MINNMQGRKNMLFVTGFPRSGTTWTNRIFLQCFDCGFANEVQFIFQFYKKLHRYGDLRNGENLHRLLGDLVDDEYFRILKKSYNIALRREDILRSLNEKTYSGIVRSILDNVAMELGRGIVGGKCPSLGWDLGAFSDLFPDAKIIHVIRDGRDCALSHYGMAWGFRNAYVAAIQWSRYVRGARAIGTQLGPERYYEFRYEDLLTEPERIVLDLEGFIHGEEILKITECVLEITKKSTMINNFNKWKSAMSKQEQAVFETVAGKELADCGYELAGDMVDIKIHKKIYWILDDRLRRELRALSRRIWTSSPEKLDKKH